MYKEYAAAPSGSEKSQAEAGNNGSEPGETVQGAEATPISEETSGAVTISADEVMDEGAGDELGETSEPSEGEGGFPDDGESSSVQPEETVVESSTPDPEEAESEDAGSQDTDDPQSEKLRADLTETKAAELLTSMSLEEKVAQLFFVELGALTGISHTTDVGDITRGAYNQYPVGGFILMEYNITENLAGFTSDLDALGRERVGVAPFIGIDEEGGRVTRLSAVLGCPNVGSMADLGATGDFEKAYEAGSTIGAYMDEYGCTVDFAPVADVLSNPESSVIGSRSFGSDAALVAGMVSRYVAGLRDSNILAALKHFPGHGSSSSDTHQGAAVSYITEEEWRSTDYVSFLSGIEAGAEFVMMGHVSYPTMLNGDYTPASLSYHFITEVLREEMGFEGVILTDGMNMGAITDNYSSADAAVKALNAGCDIILMPASFESAYRGVLDAVDSGTLSEERIDESVMRILRLKLRQAADKENVNIVESFDHGLE